MSEANQLSAFAEEIIAFQRRNHLTDTEMALNSHVSVEHIHDIKAMRETADPALVRALHDYMIQKPNGK